MCAVYRVGAILLETEERIYGDARAPRNFPSLSRPFVHDIITEKWLLLLHSALVCRYNYYYERALGVAYTHHLQRPFVLQWLCSVVTAV